MTPIDNVEDPDDDDEITVNVELGEASILFAFDEGQLKVRSSSIESFYDSVLTLFPLNETSVELIAFDIAEEEVS